MSEVVELAQDRVLDGVDVLGRYPVEPVARRLCRSQLDVHYVVLSQEERESTQKSFLDSTGTTSGLETS